MLQKFGQLGSTFEKPNFCKLRLKRSTVKKKGKKEHFIPPWQQHPSLK